MFVALEPETKTQLTGRSSVKITKKDGNLMLTFKAMDTSALRAAINSYLHWVFLTKAILETVKTH